MVNQKTFIATYQPEKMPYCSSHRLCFRTPQSTTLVSGNLISSTH